MFLSTITSRAHLWNYLGLSQQLGYFRNTESLNLFVVKMKKLLNTVFCNARNIQTSEKKSNIPCKFEKAFHHPCLGNPCLGSSIEVFWRFTTTDI